MSEKKLRYLPEKTINWLDEQDKSFWEKRPELYKGLLKLQEIAPPLDEHNIQEFKALHSLEYPDSSTANLDIPNGLLLDLLWNDIYMIEKLEFYLLESTTIDFSDANQENGLKELNVALHKW